MDQDREVKMDTECQPGLTLGTLGLAIFTKILWLIQGPWKNNPRTKNEPFPAECHTYPPEPPVSPCS